MKKKGLLKIELEKQKKREVEADEDYLNEVLKPHGRQYVADVADDELRTEKRAKADVLTGLELNKDRRFTYLKKLESWGQKGLEEIEFPKGWQYDCVATSDRNVKIYGRWFKAQYGLVIVLKAPTGEVYVRAMMACNQPELDLQLLNNLVLQAENTLDDYKGLLLKQDQATGFKVTKSGLLVP